VPLVTFPVLAWLLRVENRRALAVASTGAFLVYILARFDVPQFVARQDAYSPRKILGDLIPPYYDSLVFHLSGATILLLLLAVALGRWRRYGLAASLACALATTWLCLSVGTWIQYKTPSFSFDAMSADRAASPAAHSVGNEGFGLEMRSVAEYRNRKLTVDRPLGVIVHGAAPTVSDEEVWKQMTSSTPLRPMFVDGALQPTARASVAETDTVALVYNTSNRYRFNVVAAKDGYFVLGMPLLAGFVCLLDGSFVLVTRANALYPSVFLPRGFHVVDFYFVSWPFLVGVGIAFGTLWALATWAVGRRRRSWVSRAMVLAALPLVVVLWVFLYAGPSFNTEYFWQVKPP